MKIAIHSTSGSFSDLWIEYCERNNILFKVVNCFQSDIMHQLEDCDALFWHFQLTSSKDLLFARQILFSVELSGKKVFPDFRTSWHYDDKVGQKYLFESIGAPLVPSYIFYSKSTALQWISQTTFPKVFKLRGGAGSQNVRLVRSAIQARKLVRKAFGQGFGRVSRVSNLKERIRRYKEGNDSLAGVIKSTGRLLILNKDDKKKAAYSKILGRDRGYVYFQDFIPGNSFDIRIIIVDDKAFAIKRMVRDSDFRASGSGNAVYERKEIDERCIQMAFNTSTKLELQCAAYDFIFDENNIPKILEVSYAFLKEGYFDCPGYWDKKIVWHEGKFNPYGWMIESVLSS